MNYETKRPLMEQIDKNLLEHMVAAGTKEGGPKILDAYLLQGLSETHYYLKVEHDFKPNEVAALLQFTDPLAVARECWEERDPKKGFPICELLHTINAYKRFPLVDPAGVAQQEAEVIQALNELLDKNMADFDNTLEGMTKAEISAIEEVISTREIYNFIRNEYAPGFERHEAELLLRMENPLQFIVDNWPCDDLAALATKHLASKEIEDVSKEVSSQPSHDAKNTVVAKKTSILEQIKTSRQEARQKIAPEDRAKGGDAR